MNYQLNKGSKEDLDKIYYNVTIRHKGNNSIPAEYQEDRTVALVNKPDDYYMTISRFNIPATNIPIFIFDVQDNQANPNLGVYSVTLVDQDSNDAYQEFLNYLPDSNLPVPSSPIPKQNRGNPYYWVFTYERMLEMVNNALANAFTTLKLDHPGAAPSEPPYFIYDSKTQLISLITQTSYDAPLGGSIDIFTNSQLFTFLESMRRKFFGRNQVDGRDFQHLVLSEPGNNNAYAPPGQTIPAWPANPPNYLQMEQEYFSLQGWNTFNDLVFTTATIPISNEYIQSNENTSGNSNFFPILTDFEPIFDKIGDQRSIISYSAPGNYRLINLNSPSPLIKFDFKIWWKDRLTGNLYPVTIGYNEEVNVKFLFLKKDSFTS